MALIPLDCNDDFGFERLFGDMDREFDDMRRAMANDMRHMRRAMARLQPHQEEKALDTGMVSQLKQIREPIVTNEDGTRKLQLQLDMSNFKPEEVTIKTEKNLLKIDAEHKDESDHSAVYHKFSRQFTLPKDVDSSTITAKLANDGLLTIQSANLPAIEDGSGEAPSAKIAKKE